MQVQGIPSQATFKSIDRFPGYAFGDDGTIWSFKTGQWKRLSQGLMPNGYYNVALKTGGKMKTHRSNRVILEAFVGPCPPGMQACHNNGNPGDNRVENLRWDTPKGNARDRDIHGTSDAARGANHWSAKIQASDVVAIREMYATGRYAQKDIAMRFNIKQAQVSSIVRRQKWKHVP